MKHALNPSVTSISVALNNCIRAFPEQDDDIYGATRRHHAVKEQFIKTLIKIQRIDEAEAGSICDREALYYKKALLASPKLQSCTNISLYSAFLELAITGLSIQPGGKSEAFLESRGAKQPETAKRILF